MSETQDAGREAWDSLNEYIEETDAENKVDACRKDLDYLEWTDMQKIARAVGIDMSDSPTKKEVQHRLAEAHVFTDGPTGEGKVYQMNDGDIEQVVMLETSSSNTTMSEAETADESETSSLNEHPYGDLMNLARSAREQFESVEIDTDAPKKDELVESLQEYAPEGSRSTGWTIEVDGSRQEVDLLKVQTPEGDASGGATGPTDSTILYCLTRAETTSERVEQIREAVEENTPFELRQSESGDKYLIVLPAEEQEGYEEAQEAEEDEEAESDEESDSSESEGEESEDEEESSESESEEDEEDSEDEAEEESEEEVEEEEDESDDEEATDDSDEEESEEEEAESDENEEVLDAGVVRDRWDDTKSKDDLYMMAKEEDIDGRSDMSKDELIEALIEAKDEIAA